MGGRIKVTKSRKVYGRERMAYGARGWIRGKGLLQIIQGQRRLRLVAPAQALLLALGALTIQLAGNGQSE